jgi:hypothetical protein
MASYIVLATVLATWLGPCIGIRYMGSYMDYVLATWLATWTRIRDMASYTDWY